jgi:hypothetical protein
LGKNLTVTAGHPYTCPDTLLFKDYYHATWYGSGGKLYASPQIHISG